jgi:hypothetical protein
MLVRSVKLDGPATFMMSSVISNPENRLNLLNIIPQYDCFCG